MYDISVNFEFDFSSIDFGDFYLQIMHDAIGYVCGAAQFYDI